MRAETALEEALRHDVETLSGAIGERNLSQYRRLVAAAEIRVGGDLGAGKAVSGDPQRRQVLIEGLRAQLTQGREEHKLLDRQVSQGEKRLDRACRITLSPLHFEMGRIIRRSPDRISIDLSSVYQSLGEMPADQLALALNEFFAKGLIGVLSRANRQYLSGNPAREKVFLQLLGQLRELFLLVIRRDQARRKLETLEGQIDQWVADFYTAPRRICVRGAVLPGAHMEFLHPHAEDLGERERGEDPDSVERNQGVGASLEDHNQGGRGQSQDDDAVGEDEPISAIAELSREKTVPRHEEGEPREISKRGVGRQDQDHGGDSLDIIVGDPASKDLPGELGNHRLLLPRDDPVQGREQGHAHEERRHDHREPSQGDPGVPDFGGLEGSNSISDGLDPGKSHSPGRKGSEDQKHPDG